MASADRSRVAVVGAAGRFPGAASLREYWRLLVEGRVAAAEPDESRGDLWKAARDPALGPKITTLKAGYMADVAGFDAEYFSVSPREAVKLDPQQRLLMEVTHDALEDGGITRAELQRSSVGVFVGAGSTDYMSLDSGQKQHLDGYYGIGNSHNLLAGRISYFLNLKGPSLAIDTACSSSLTALHFAVQSLRGGEIDLAIVGGVNVIVSPDLTLAFSQAKMLSPTGRCMTFSKDADGYGRAEGVGVIVLRCLPDEELERHVVRCFVASTAVNQDGRSNGIAAPNGNSQVRVIRAALDRAGITPADVAYVETHGTGTPLGDAIELHALKDVFESAGASCFVGSAKASIGHAEAAAGICGLLKGLLMLEHGVIPPHPVARPYASFFDASPETRGGALHIAEHARPIDERLRHVGVSSFGFGGSNAHVVLERHGASRAASDANDASYGPSSAPSSEVSKEAGRPLLLTLSSHFERGLDEDAAELAAYIASSGVAIESIAHTLAHGRDHLAHRRACVARTRSEAAAALREPRSARAPLPVAAGERPKIAFAFTGQGSQYFDMGRELYDSVAPFRSAFDRCDDAIARRAGISMARVVYGAARGASRVQRDANEGEKSGDDRLTGDTHAAQLALFAFEYALASLWMEIGVRPSFAIGHSVGELVAHTIAGSLSLDDGVALVHERGRLMQSVAQDGAMVAVSAGVATVTALLDDLRARCAPLHVAAVNGKERVVVSGDRAAVAHLVERLERERLRFRVLRTRHAFHSPIFDDAAADLAAFARGIDARPAAIPVAGNVDGAIVREGALDGAYWGRHIAMPVHFARGVETLVDLGAQVFLEIGPDRVLAQLIAGDHGAKVRALSSVVREGDSEQSFLRAVGALYELGFDIDFSPLSGAGPRRVVSLPPRRLSHKRYWTASGATAAADAGDADEVVAAAPPRDDDHPVNVAIDSAVHAVIDRQLDVMRAQLSLLSDF